MRPLICLAAFVVLCLSSAPEVPAQTGTAPLLNGQQTTFACSNCGKEVPGDATSCPHCGTEFAEDVYVPPKELLAPTPSPPSGTGGNTGIEHQGAAPIAPAGAPAAPQAPTTVAGGEPETPFLQSTPFKIGVFVVTALILLRWFFRN